MPSTRVVNIHRNATFDVYIGRAGNGWKDKYGNPFRVGSGPFARDEAIEAFRAWFSQNIAAGEEYRRKIFELKGKVLGCFCAPKACHGDVYVNFLEGLHYECRCGWGAGPPPTGFKRPQIVMGPDTLERCSRCWWVPAAAQSHGFERWQK